MFVLGHFILWMITPRLGIELATGLSMQYKAASCRSRGQEAPNLIPDFAEAPTTTRKYFLLQTALLVCPGVASAKCTDIESCREIGERKDAEDLARNPIVRLGNGGLQYKVLSVGTGSQVVQPESTIRIAYSISQANGSYMYSRGFGYNKIDGVGTQQKVNDAGLDSLAVQMGSSDIPIGIQKALVGAKRGERRRVQCPPEVGFETSNWNPKPTTFRGERQMIDYRSKLEGTAGGLAFPAPTVWDVEVVSIR